MSLATIALGTFLTSGCSPTGEEASAEMNIPPLSVQTLDLSNLTQLEVAREKADQFSRFQCASESIRALEPVLDSFSQEIAFVCPPPHPFK